MTGDRPTATVLTAATLHQGTFQSGEGWNASGVLLPDGRTVHIVDLVGTLVSSDAGSMGWGAVLDDGTGKITLRRSQPPQGNSFPPGTPVRVLGRPREYNTERYLQVDVIKPLTQQSQVSYFVLRRELFTQTSASPTSASLSTPATTPTHVPPSVVQVPVSPTVQPETMRAPPKETHPVDTPRAKIITLIRELDKGTGADIEDVIALSRLGDAQDIIQTLIERGDVFEVRPGRLKIIE